MSGQGGAPGWGVCFQGACDNYEAAGALAEVGALDWLLTDVYLDRAWMRRLLARRLSRRRAGRIRSTMAC